MKKIKWDLNEMGTMSIDCAANGFYYEWTEIDVNGKNLEDLVKKYLGADDFEDKKVRVKARNGALFIVSAGDIDDQPNIEDGCDGEKT